MLQASGEDKKNENPESVTEKRDEIIRDATKVAKEEKKIARQAAEEKKQKKEEKTKQHQAMTDEAQASRHKQRLETEAFVSLNAPFYYDLAKALGSGRRAHEYACSLLNLRCVQS